MWREEGTGSTRTSGAAVECVAESKGGSKCNAMWRGEDAGVSEGTHCWAFRVLAGDGLWVGLTTEAKFGPGWKCKGVMYGGPGNTSNGGGLVQGGFGQPVKEGDELGVYLSVKEQPARTVSVRFFHNQRPLGEAFRFPQAAPTPLFPVVGFHGAGEKVSISKVEPPAELDRAPQACEGPEGHYVLRACQGPGGEALSFPAATMKMAARGPGFGLSIKAGNSINAGVRPTEGGGGWAGGPVMSTKMYCEETAELERFLGGVVGETLTGFAVAGGTVTVSSPSGTARFEREEPPAPEPCTEDFLS